MKDDARYRPFHVRLLNAAGCLATSAGWVERNLDPDRLMDLACRRTGLGDFGPEDFLEPFRLLTECFRKEAQLNFKNENRKGIK